MSNGFALGVTVKLNTDRKCQHRKMNDNPFLAGLFVVAIIGTAVLIMVCIK